MTFRDSLPFSVSLYSARGGISAYDFRVAIPVFSSSCSIQERVDAETPLSSLLSSVNLTAPCFPIELIVNRTHFLPSRSVVPLRAHVRTCESLRFVSQERQCGNRFKNVNSNSRPDCK